MKPIYEEYLKSYQRDGIDKMKYLNGNVILADEPGLGKTIQTIGYLYESKNYPAIIVCPASLKLNWEQELRKWIACKDKDIYICEGTQDTERKAKVASNAKFVIINYDILIHWAYNLYYNGYYKAIVFDEAHMIKEDRQSNIMKPVRKYGIACVSETDRVSAAEFLCTRIRHKIFITGTPIVNGAADLANFVYWLEAFTFRGYENFLTTYTNKKYNSRLKKYEYLGGKNLLELNSVLNDNFVIRRKKVTATPELPNKNRVFIPMECEFYAKLGKRVSINKLQKERVARTEYILEMAISWVKDFLETDKKLVVFCNFTATVDALKKEFGDDAVVFDGRCTPIEKDRAVKEFQGNPSIKLFIGNLQAAGVGITLTAADTVLTIDFSHTVKDHYQAEDRVCRIGQKSDSVTAYYIYVPNSVDEQMIDNLNEKAEVAKMAVDGEEVTNADLFDRDNYYRKYTDEEQRVIESEQFKRTLKDLGLFILMVIFSALTFFLIIDVAKMMKEEAINDNND